MLFIMLSLLCAHKHLLVFKFNMLQCDDNSVRILLLQIALQTAVVAL